MYNHVNLSKLSFTGLNITRYSLPYEFVTYNNSLVDDMVGGAIIINIGQSCVKCFDFVTAKTCFV